MLRVALSFPKTHQKERQARLLGGEWGWVSGLVQVAGKQFTSWFPLCVGSLQPNVPVVHRWQVVLWVSEARPPVYYEHT